MDACFTHEWEPPTLRASLSDSTRPAQAPPRWPPRLSDVVAVQDFATCSLLRQVQKVAREMQGFVRLACHSQIAKVFFCPYGLCRPLRHLSRRDELRAVVFQAWRSKITQVIIRPCGLYTSPRAPNLDFVRVTVGLREARTRHRQKILRLLICVE